MFNSRLRQINRSLKRLYRRFRRVAFRGSRVLVLGDSHVGVFEFISDNDLLSPHMLQTIMVTGATACGLNKNNATTGAYQRFLDALHRTQKPGVLIYMLGEVDCNVLFWLKSSGQVKIDDTLMHESIRGIKRLVKASISLHPDTAHIIAGAHLPTVKDSDALLQEHPLRLKVTASLHERTRVVLRFNNYLQELARELGVNYLDISDEILDGQSGIVRSHYCMTRAVDHHLNDAMAAPLWATLLRPYLASQQSNARFSRDKGK